MAPLEVDKVQKDQQVQFTGDVFMYLDKSFTAYIYKQAEDYQTVVICTEKSCISKQDALKTKPFKCRGETNNIIPSNKDQNQKSLVKETTQQKNNRRGRIKTLPRVIFFRAILK